jgi:hypothetical protein
MRWPRLSRPSFFCAARRAAKNHAAEGRTYSRRRCCVHAAPATVAPRQIPSATPAKRLRNEVEPRRSEGMTTAQSRQRHPSACPQSEPADRLVGIIGTGRQMPAVRTDQWREHDAIKCDQRPSGLSGGASADVEQFAEQHCQGVWVKRRRYSAATEPRLASISSIADTTASKVSKVEAWRAL